MQGGANERLVGSMKRNECTNEGTREEERTGVQTKSKSKKATGSAQWDRTQH